MATLYVDSGVAGGDGSGDSWANAFSTLVACLADAACVAGSTVYIDSTHVEGGSTTLTLTNSGTHVAPIFVISVLNGGTTYTTGALIDHGGSGQLQLRGVLKFYGVDFGDGGGRDWAPSDSYTEIHDSVIKLASNFYIATTLDDSEIVFRDCTFRPSGTGGIFRIYSGNRLACFNCSIDNTDATPTGFVNVWSGQGSTVEFHDCDFTDMGTSSALLLAQPSGATTNAGIGSRFIASNCLMPVTGTMADSDVVNASFKIEAYNCSPVASDEANSVYIETVNGVVQNNTANYLTSTANGGNQWSFEVVARNTSQAIFEPVRFLVGEVYAEAGATIGVEVAADLAVNDDEFWIEVVYPPTTTGWASGRRTATTLLSHETGGSADVSLPNLSATPSALSTGTTWTTNGATDIGTPVYMKAEVVLTVAGDVSIASEAGIVQVWANYGDSSALTLYVDSEIQVS